MAETATAETQDVPATDSTPKVDESKDVPAGDSTPKTDSPPPPNDPTKKTATSPDDDGDLEGWSSVGLAGPEGKRGLTRAVGIYYAGVYNDPNNPSDNPGHGVRGSLELQKQIDAFPQDLSVADAKHLWETVFLPKLGQMKIKQVEGDYDTRGKALLDQIYAPLGHGSTKPTWDQIPKNERIAAAAYAVVSALRGHGAQALEGLVRPLTLQEQENVKKEQEKDQNEQLRRQGLVEQFNVLMGNKKAEVSQLELTQRENAAQRIADGRNAEAEKKLTLAQQKQQDLTSNRAKARWAKSKDNTAIDDTQKLSDLHDYEGEMQEITGDPNWKAPKSDYDAASKKSTQQEARESRIKFTKDRDDRFVAESKSDIQYHNERADNMKKQGLIDDQKLSDMKERAKNLVPWIEKNARAHYTTQMLDIDKLQNEKLHGWVRSKPPPDSTILTDANGRQITDSSGHPIGTFGQARSKLTDMEGLVTHQAKKLQDDIIFSGASKEFAESLKGSVRELFDHGMSASQVKEQITGMVQGVEMGMGKIDPTFIDRAVAIGQQSFQNDQLREKLGSAQQEKVHQGGGGRQYTPEQMQTQHDLYLKAGGTEAGFKAWAASHGG